MRYTLLHWQLIDHFDLLTSQYILLDTIHFLSQKTGWCYASRRQLARSMRMTARSVYSLIDTLEEKGLVEIEPRSRQLRCSSRWQKAVSCCNEGNVLPPAEKTSPAEKSSAGEKVAPGETISSVEETSSGEKTSVAEEISPDEIHAPVQKLQSEGERIAYGSEEISDGVVKKIHPATEKTSPNHTNKKYTLTTKTKHTKEHTQKPVLASPVFSQKDSNENQPEEPTHPQINFSEPEPVSTETIAVEEKTPVATPPPLAAAPSPEKPVPIKTTPAKGQAGTEADDTEPCMADCRQLYLAQFALYQWQHGRDDKFLKEVLAQIRYKIAARLGQRDLLLRDVDGDAVTASFAVLIRHIPQWHRDNGYTTPLDLKRYFERYFTAIQSGQGGGMNHSLKPGTEQDLETMRLLLKYR